MKTSVHFYQFRNNDVINDNFTSSGIVALWDYLEEYEDSIGQEIEFDPVALRMEFTDYGSLEEVIGDYPEITSLEDLQYNTLAIEHEEGILIQNF